ncbi:DUF4072 domain-containing protein, partial [Paraburkholderia sp. SIMBA_049]
MARSRRSGPTPDRARVRRRPHAGRARVSFAFNHSAMTHNLVIQSLAPLSDAHHKPLLALSRGTRIVQTDEHAL